MGGWVGGCWVATAGFGWAASEVRGQGTSWESVCCCRAGTLSAKPAACGAASRVPPHCSAAAQLHACFAPANRRRPEPHGAWPQGGRHLWILRHPLLHRWVASARVSPLLAALVGRVVAILGGFDSATSVPLAVADRHRLHLPSRLAPGCLAHCTCPWHASR